jgi:ABC-type amino acid transport substrate-binding protein
MRQKRLFPMVALTAVLALVAAACGGDDEAVDGESPTPTIRAIEGVDDLQDGDVVGVQSGTTGEIYAKENLQPEGVTIRAFPEGPDAYAALSACQLDGAVNDEVFAVFQVEEKPELEVVEGIDTDEVYGIAVNPDNDDLLEAINVELAPIIEDGTYEEFFNKYPLLVEELAAASIVDEFQSTASGDTPPEFTTVKEGVLTVGSDIPYAPFEFREGGELRGFDIDLIGEIADRLGLTIDVRDTAFDTAFTQLAAGRYDIVIAASTITPEREEEVDFSDGYFKARQSLTVNPTCE